VPRPEPKELVVTEEVKLVAEELIRRERLPYANCIADEYGRFVSFSIVDNRVVLNATEGVDMSDTTDVVSNFLINIDGSVYGGGEGSAHGSCGFFYKMTNEKIDWALMSLESNPFVNATQVGNDISFLSTSGLNWIVPNGKISNTYLLNSGNFND
jgi:hypothetical protein